MARSFDADLDRFLSDLSIVGPAGVTFVLNLKHLTPEFYKSSYPQVWQDEYNRRGFALRDPVILWAMTNIGTKRWSEIGGAYRIMGGGVMRAAESYRINYGVVISGRVEDERKRKCFISLARSDREIVDGEIKFAETIFQNILEKISNLTDISERTLLILRRVADGVSQEAIGKELSISRETVKLDLAKVKKELGARNTSHAIFLATKRGLLDM